MAGGTDAQGEPAARYETDAFGNLLDRSGEVPNPFVYAGREHDAALGLYYFRARYYDPALGRFLTPDPVEGVLDEPATLNRYVFARNAPTEFADPLGLAAFKRYDYIDYQYWQKLGISAEKIGRISICAASCKLAKLRSRAEG